MGPWIWGPENDGRNSNAGNAGPGHLRNNTYDSPPGRLHHWHHALDICQPTEAQHGQDRVVARQALSLMSDSHPERKLGATVIVALDSERLLGVHIESDLSLDQHVSKVAAHWFCRLIQLQRIRRSLDAESTATLARAFVTSRIDYRNSVHVGAPKEFTDKLQWVLNDALHVISAACKYDWGLSQPLHEKLHWRYIRDRPIVTFKLMVMVHRCLNGLVPQYLAVHCIPLYSRRHLHSAERNLLHVPRHRLNTYGRRAFATSGQSSWNIFFGPWPQSKLHLVPADFRRLLKTFCSHLSRHGDTLAMRYTNWNINTDIDMFSLGKRKDR